MSKKMTNAELVAENIRLREIIAKLPETHVSMAEYRRVQGVLRTTQQFHAKAKRKLNELQPTSDWKTRAAAAREAAMQSGASVVV